MLAPPDSACLCRHMVGAPNSHPRLCAALNVARFFLSPPDAVSSAVANRLFTVLSSASEGCSSPRGEAGGGRSQGPSWLIAICAYCKKIRDIHGYREQIERYRLLDLKQIQQETPSGRIQSHRQPSTAGLNHMSNCDQTSPSRTDRFGAVVLAPRYVAHEHAEGECDVPHIFFDRSAAQHC
jgi:hypothetical protein